MNLNITRCYSTLKSKVFPLYNSTFLFNKIMFFPNLGQHFSVPSSTLRTSFLHGHLLSGAQTMKWCQSLPLKRKTNCHIWYHTWFPWDILLFPSAKPNTIMYYILFYVIFTIRPWQWWLILLQWNLYVFNQKLFYVDSSLHSGF